MEISNEIKYIGVFDREIDLFEGQYTVKDGVSYNSYIIKDRKIAVMDTVDKSFVGEWLARLDTELDGRQPDYLIVHHMEPDHSSGIKSFLDKYPEATVIASQAAFRMMRGFFGTEFEGRRRIVTEGDTLSLGEHTLTFITAPMVHWPEVIMTFDARDGVLFSADGFGKFGGFEIGREWVDEARRYYIGIVGKYGKQVQAVLKKAAALDIKKICPLHGPVLSENLEFYIDLYDKWSSYTPEQSGVTVAYASIYGNTKAAALYLSERLKERGVAVSLYDLSRCEKYAPIADAFRFDRLVLAAATYNMGVFPPMREFVTELSERGYKNRRVALIENGSWAPAAAKVMRQILGEEVEYLDRVVKITSAPTEANYRELDGLVNDLLA
ncbi:MAG: FprA family A-type flavoprotein [Clostridia bacterium]|nr:FprA family A-type flavoprotein [Clostridia bacterium]